MTQGALKGIDLPSGWSWEPLGYLAPRVTGAGRGDLEPLSVYLGAGVVRRADRDDNHNVLGADMDKYLHVLPGDLVFNKLRTWQGGLGASKYEGVVSPAYYVLRTGERLDARFVNYVLLSSPYLAELTRLSKFMPPSQFDMPWEALKRLPILVPPIEEQRRIADFLDDQVRRIDLQVAAREAQSRILIERRDADLSRVLLGGKMRATGKGPWFEGVDQPWILAPLRARWQVIDCKHRTPDYVDDGYPVISPGDVSAGVLDLESATRFVDASDYEDLADDLRRCRRGDLVYSRNASAGTAAIVDTDAPFTMGQDVCRITSRDQDQRFLMYFLNTLSVPQLDSVRVGSTFTRINVDQIKALMVPVPPVDLQAAIASDCDRIWEATSVMTLELQGSVSLLQARKRSLISAAVTGQLDVTATRTLTGPWISPPASSSQLELVPQAAGVAL